MAAIAAYEQFGIAAMGRSYMPRAGEGTGTRAGCPSPSYQAPLVTRMTYRPL